MSKDKSNFETYRTENEERVIRDTKIITLPTAAKSFWIKIIVAQLFVVFAVFGAYNFKSLTRHYCIIESDSYEGSGFQVVMTNVFWFNTTVGREIKDYKEAIVIKKEICENNIQVMNK